MDTSSVGGSSSAVGIAGVELNLLEVLRKRDAQLAGSDPAAEALPHRSRSRASRDESKSVASARRRNRDHGAVASPSHRSGRGESLAPGTTGFTTPPKRESRIEHRSTDSSARARARARSDTRKRQGGSARRKRQPENPLLAQRSRVSHKS